MDKPEALRLAAALEVRGLLGTTAHEAAAELRRLVAENERLHEMNRDLLNAYNKMRNSAAGYSNFCDDNANTRRCERDYVAAEDMYRAAIAKAEGQQ